ncbi:hypothetical protein BDN72DRAFT_864213 [Pluteus cervinus]|uniref:Uncharacterized protein n=1 Tax=Pluteus cervinus TaxID=181527 RepID=A0ACD3A4M8_9AGAR|nr:hypothetical protein BDN72DRAFT_864213 [Pluteus cervinus]
MTTILGSNRVRDIFKHVFGFINVRRGCQVDGSGNLLVYHGSVKTAGTEPEYMDAAGIPVPVLWIRQIFAQIFNWDNGRAGLVDHSQNTVYCIPYVGRPFSLYTLDCEKANHSPKENIQLGPLRQSELDWVVQLCHLRRRSTKSTKVHESQKDKLYEREGESHNISPPESLKFRVPANLKLMEVDSRPRNLEHLVISFWGIGEFREPLDIGQVFRNVDTRVEEPFDSGS